MNTARITSAALTIDENTRALSWLREYGHQLTGRSDAASVSVRVVFAGSCPGAKDAEKVLTAFATLDLPATVQTAIRNCENTIVMCRDAIREEVGEQA